MSVGKIATSITIFALVVLFLGNLWNQKKESDITILNHDIEQLAAILQTIHTTCTINGFDAQKNSINFLNVKEFSGSEVGPINLAHPKKWQGPYLKDNPTYQTIEYQIVRTKKGYFITPGDGVQLPNGKIVGKDLILNEDSDINELLKEGNSFNVNGKKLAAHLPFIHTKAEFWASVVAEE